MRVLLAALVVACAPPPRRVPDPSPPVVHAQVPEPTPPARVRVVAPALDARELIARSNVASFDDLRRAAIDGDAMELWFSRKPEGAYLYTERVIDGHEPRDQVRGRCQRLARERGSSILNAIALVAWQRGDRRLVLELGQTTVAVQEQERDGGGWDTRSVRPLPMEAVGWNGEHIRYAEDAKRYEVACVPALRTVSCGTADQVGHCVDRELVVRPWRVPFVPHVGPVRPGYHDEIPSIPDGSCDVTCAPSACDEALRTQPIPFVPLYEETAPVFAAFRTEAACRAYASTRKPPVDDRTW